DHPDQTDTNRAQLPSSGTTTPETTKRVFVRAVSCQVTADGIDLDGLAEREPLPQERIAHHSQADRSARRARRGRRVDEGRPGGDRAEPSRKLTMAAHTSLGTCNPNMCSLLSVASWLWTPRRAVYERAKASARKKRGIHALAHVRAESWPTGAPLNH